MRKYKIVVVSKRQIFGGSPLDDALADIYHLDSANCAVARCVPPDEDAPVLYIAFNNNNWKKVRAIRARIARVHELLDNEKWEELLGHFVIYNIDFGPFLDEWGKRMEPYPLLQRSINNLREHRKHAVDADQASLLKAARLYKEVVKCAQRVSNGTERPQLRVLLPDVPVVGKCYWGTITSVDSRDYALLEGISSEVQGYIPRKEITPLKGSKKQYPNLPKQALQNGQQVLVRVEEHDATATPPMRIRLSMKTALHTPSAEEEGDPSSKSTKGDSSSVEEGSNGGVVEMPPHWDFYMEKLLLAASTTAILRLYKSQVPQLSPVLVDNTHNHHSEAALVYSGLIPEGTPIGSAKLCCAVCHRLLRGLEKEEGDERADDYPHTGCHGLAFHLHDDALDDKYALKDLEEKFQQSMHEGRYACTDDDKERYMVENAMHQPLFFDCNNELMDLLGCTMAELKESVGLKC